MSLVSAWGATTDLRLDDPDRETLACLVAPAREELRYPQDRVESKIRAVVRVRLTFRSRDGEPSIEVFKTTGERVFTEAVVNHVKRYRLPCLPEGRAVTATQEFDFTPGDGRHAFWYPVRSDGASHFDCLKLPDEPPEYPHYGVRKGVKSAVVLAQYVFPGPNQSPEVTILYNGGTSDFAETVKAWAVQVRLPCMPEGNPPVKGSQAFHFHVEGEQLRRLKNIDLRTFVSVSANALESHARFDFNTMGCPFDLRFALRRPYADNLVAEVERSDPNRREFLEWLRQIEWRISARDLRDVFDDVTTISVPCGTLDLSS